MNVLLVDDNRELRHATREILEILGHQVTEAASAEEALQRAAAADGSPRLELLVTDLSMSGMDGVELIARMLAAHPDLAVLLVSSEPDDRRLRARVDLGDVAFLAKPYSAAMLGAGIDAAVAGKAVRGRSSPAPPDQEGAGRPRAEPPRRPFRESKGTRGRDAAQLPVSAAAAAAALMVAATILSLEPDPPLLPEPPATTAVRGTAIELVDPVGPIAELPPAFRWQPVDGAAAYRLTVRAVDDRVVWQRDVPATAGGEPRLELGTELAARLLPSVAYTWSVAASNDGGERIAWSDRIRFRVIPRAGDGRTGAPR